jgi:hypothetical protein
MAAFLACVLLWSSAGGCGTELDFSNLKFSKGSADTKTVDAALDGKGDAPGQEDVRPDSEKPEDVKPELPKPVGPSCVDVLTCVLEKQCYDFSQDKCFGDCDGNGNWQENDNIRKLKECVAECSQTVAPEDLPSCFELDCLKDLMYCVTEKDGTDTCADVVNCSLNQCAGKGDSWDGFKCWAECSANLDYGQLNIVTDYIETCSIGTIQYDAQCMGLFFDCYGGSGDKTCYQVSSCITECNKMPCPPDWEGEGSCPEQQQCCLNCAYGLSEDAQQPLYDSGSCFFSNEANAFTCLLAHLDCHQGYLNGGSKCGPVVKEIRKAYDMNEGGNSYGAMFAMSEKIVPVEEEIDRLRSVLDCLGDLWPAFPGYGAIPEAAWNSCAELCQ